MKKQILSFKYAFCGVLKAIESESHMRFHMVAGFYVLLFSFFYKFSPTQWSLLVILIASIMVLEVVNTCIEEVCNLISEEYHPLIKVIKDMAAGAVLIMSIAAVVVAVLFFVKVDVIFGIINFFLSNIIYLILLIISAVFSVIFVMLGPVGIKNKISSRKAKKRCDTAHNS